MQADNINISGFNDETTDETDEKKYLIFSLGGELYGSELEGIKEVRKMMPIKKVPLMVAHFEGVVNLRGQIISVIDLREKFGLPKDLSADPLLLVVESANGGISTIVDEVIAVKHIPPTDIERNPVVESKIPPEFLVGFARVGDRIATLVRIEGCLASEDLKLLKAATQAA